MSTVCSAYSKGANDFFFKKRLTKEKETPASWLTFEMSRDRFQKYSSLYHVSHPILFDCCGLLFEDMEGLTAFLAVAEFSQAEGRVVFQIFCKCSGCFFEIKR